MTHWNANNYSKQMVRDIRKIRRTRKLREAELIESIPPTPIEEEALLRRYSRPTLFSRSQILSKGPSDLQVSAKISMERRLSHQGGDLNKSKQSLSPSPSDGDLSHGISPAQQLAHQRPPYATLPTEIQRIQEENNEILSKVNNAPVQYSKPKYNEEEYETE